VTRLTHTLEVGIPMPILRRVLPTVDRVGVEAKIVPPVSLAVWAGMVSFGSGWRFGEIHEGVWMVNRQIVVVCHTSNITYY